MSARIVRCSTCGENADTRARLAEVEAERDRLAGELAATNKALNHRIDIANECLAFLSGAGHGAPGQVNTLWAMCREAGQERARADAAEREVRRLVEELESSGIADLRTQLELTRNSRETNAARAAKLEAVCDALLLFHGGGPWDAHKADKWAALSGCQEATTKVLCDLARAARAKGDG